MNQETGLLSAAWQAVRENKRYLVWFWVLNLFLGHVGAAPVQHQIGEVLDHSLYADQLVHRFNPTVLIELLAIPQTGSLHAMETPGMLAAFMFAFVSLLLMPGVLRQYTSPYRVAKDEFFRTCGRNLWRFIRLTILYGVIALPIAGILFGVRGGLQKAADTTVYEVLPFCVGLGMLLVIFLVMTSVRIWFDLAEVDLVVKDQPSAWKAAGTGFRSLRRNFWTLLWSYVLVALFALVVLAVGVWLWHAIVPPASVVGAFLIAQIMLVLWLVARFWQRAIAAQFYMQNVLVAPGFSPSPAAGPGTGVAGAFSPSTAGAGPA